MVAQRGQEHRGGVQAHRLQPWLGAPDFEEARAEGWALTFEQAVAYALSEAGAPEGPAA
jgi:hypothetical protein